MKYAMNEVILDLVSTRKGLNPERINIGLRAFLLVADSLEKNVSYWIIIVFAMVVLLGGKSPDANHGQQHALGQCPKGED